MKRVKRRVHKAPPVTLELCLMRYRSISIGIGIVGLVVTLSSLMYISLGVISGYIGMIGCITFGATFLLGLMASISGFVAMENYQRKIDTLRITQEKKDGGKVKNSSEGQSQNKTGSINNAEDLEAGADDDSLEIQPPVPRSSFGCNVAFKPRSFLFQPRCTAGRRHHSPRPRVVIREGYGRHGHVPPATNHSI